MHQHELFRRASRRSIALLVAVCLVSIVPAKAAAAAGGGSGAQRPNVLYIIVHDLGIDLGCYGHPLVKTPNLDRLAAEGARCANYFCASTACSPSRGCIMTGRYAHSTGLIGLANNGGRRWRLPESERTIVDYLTDAGFDTASFGGQHERPADGYHYRHAGNPARRKADQMAEDLCAFLKSYDPARGPFYVNAYSQDPHAPWNRPEFLGKYAPDQIRPPAFLPNIPAIRKELAAFYGSVSFTDEALGRIFDTLRATGLERNTLVIFTTDHGIGFPRAKPTLYDPGLTTAVIFRWPAHIRPGTVVTHLLSNVDLLPTELELLGLPIPKEVQGRSFAAALTGGSYTPRPEIFAERNFHDDFDPMRCVRTTRYKLIRNYAQRSRHKLPAEATDQDTLASLFRHPWDKPRPYEELYDLQKDPLEFHDVAGDPACAGALQDLRRRLDQWMTETGDFLRGAKDFVYFPAEEARFAVPAAQTRPTRPAPAPKNSRGE
jgi:arylsulfatase A-like enzyme